MVLYGLRYIVFFKINHILIDISVQVGYFTQSFRNDEPSLT